MERPAGESGADQQNPDMWVMDMLQRRGIGDAALAAQAPTTR